MTCRDHQREPEFLQEGKVAGELLRGVHGNVILTVATIMLATIVETRVAYTGPTWCVLEMLPEPARMG